MMSQARKTETLYKNKRTSSLGDGSPLDRFETVEPLDLLRSEN